jgi:hypothetical protein
MKKINALIVCGLVLFAISCKKNEDESSSQTETQIELSQEFADLHNNLIELNQELVPTIPETRSFFRWLLVGICDAVGAACGYAVGEIPGAIILGAATSTAAIVEFTPWEYRSETINDYKTTEQEFYSRVISSDELGGALVGMYHNQSIRSVFEEKGEAIFEMSPQELIPVFEDVLPEEYEDGNSALERLRSFSVQDFVYSPESDETVESFVQRLCVKYPNVAQELTVLRTILDGIEAIQSDQDALDYTTRAMQIIADSQIAAKSKTTLVCGTSVAFESKQLWNLSGIK